MKQKQVRRLLFASLIAAVLALTTAATAQTTVDYFSFTTSSDKIDALEALIEVFEAENPDINIEYTTADYGSYFTKLQTDIAAGNAPDVFELNYENFVTFASRDTLLDIGEYLATSDKIGSDTFYSAALNAFAYEGVQLGLPITFSTVMLYYNKELFNAAGVAYPDETWVWQDVIDAATAITDAPNRVWGISQPVQFWEFYKVAAQAGGGLTVTPTVQIDTEENRAAAHYLVDKVQTHHVMPTDIEMSGVGDVDMFLNSQLGMIVTGIWMFDQITTEATFDWDVAVEPGGAQKATHFFSNAAVVSSRSDSPEAAYRWVEFLAAHPEVVEKRIELSWELSALSLDQADALASYLEKPMPANREAVFESLEYAVNPPVIENQPQLQDIINQELEAARLGTKTVEQALADAQSRVEALVNE
ncbi:MAG TPA: sugar ABC transporter substrate-binding protein [Trueperaceae bacterium]|nr:sugar ABC transporter substrate-binding protein [Trueperaceae bacterium]